MHTAIRSTHFDRDSRDDFRNGFVAAITHLRGQGHPTEEQTLAAIEVLHEFRRTQPQLEADRPRWSRHMI